MSKNLFCLRIIFFLFAALFAFGSIDPKSSSVAAAEIKKPISLSAQARFPLLAEGSEPSLYPGAAEFVYPKCSEEMRRYFVQRYLLVFLAPIYLCLIMLILLQTGLIAKFRDSCDRFKSYVLQVTLSAGGIYLLVWLIRLPLDIYSSYWLEHQFALSKQSFASWAQDELMHILVSAVIVPILLACFLLIRKFQRGFFLPLWLLLSLCSTAIVFLEPLAVDPLFNKFRQLPDCHLKTEIDKLCQNAGLPPLPVLLADKSKQTKKINAYVTGLSLSKRIVLFDTLINDLPESQILSVVAHELGHYKLKHVLTGLALTICGLLPLLYLLENSIHRYLPQLPKRWGIRTSSDPALISVFCLLIWLLPLFIAPIPAFVSRLLESEADAYAIRLTKNPLAAAELFRSLSQMNKTDPEPPALIEFWFFSHPSINHRIDYALSQLNAGTKPEEN